MSSPTSFSVGPTNREIYELLEQISEQVRTIKTVVDGIESSVEELNLTWTQERLSLALKGEVDSIRAT